MRPDFLGDADHIEAIRQANRRRRVSVIEAFDLTPHMRRIIFQEHESVAHESIRPAEWIKLHVPAAGSGKQHGRAYTIRERMNGRLTIDVALHGGLCASWARRARAGDQAEISGPRRGYKLAWPPKDLLIGADETGLAAVASILAALPREACGTVWIEVPGERDIQQIKAPPAVCVRFLPRHGASHGKLLTQAMCRLPVSSPATTVWVAAERSAALHLREHFHTQLPQEQVHTSGYWRMPPNEPLNRFPSPVNAEAA